jgi:hypothetical protein
MEGIDYLKNWAQVLFPQEYGVSHQVKKLSSVFAPPM